MAEKCFQAVITEFKNRTERITQTAWPVVKDICENAAGRFDRIAIPITDNKFVYNLTFGLQALYESQAKDIVKQFEKMIMLRVIDDNWKENLRQLDDLRHSVQNSSYEQKDPLLIFKLESVKLWDNMINQMHDSIAMTLTRARINQPEQTEQPVEITEAPEEEQKPKQPEYTTQKEELAADGSHMQQPDQPSYAPSQPRYHDPSAAPQRHAPIIRDKMPRPNDPCPCGSGKKFKHCHGKNI